jgi:hypothetical protein
MSDFLMLKQICIHYHQNNHTIPAGRSGYRDEIKSGEASSLSKNHNTLAI